VERGRPSWDWAANCGVPGDLKGPGDVVDIEGELYLDAKVHLVLIPAAAEAW
jgi:hypothetical protein